MFACVNKPIASMHFAREKHANEGSKGQFCSLGQCKFFCQHVYLSRTLEVEIKIHKECQIPVI